MKQQCKQARSPQAAIRKPMAGFTLVEVLVAVVVLAIGLLGVAGLQLVGLRYNQSAYLRTQASFLAYDMIDRMRSNSAGVNGGNYDAVDTSSPPASPGCISTAAGCTAAELASHDVREWSSQFINVDALANYTAVLPSATGAVNRTAGTRRFTVTVSWVEASDVNDPNKQLSVNVEL